MRFRPPSSTRTTASPRSATSAPQAPVHVLIVPNKPIPTVNDVTDGRRAHARPHVRRRARHRESRGHRGRRLPAHRELQQTWRAGGVSPAHASGRRAIRSVRCSPEENMASKKEEESGPRRRRRPRRRRAKPRRAGAQARRFLSADQDRTTPGMLRVSPRARDLLRGERQPEGQARGVPARRSRRRHGSEDAPLLRSEALSHRAVRSARLRQEPAVGEPRRQHDLASGRRHRGAARAPRDRALAGVRRLVGLHARARLRAEASRALHRARAARHLPAAPARARLVLPEPARRRCSRTCWERLPRAAVAEAERGDCMRLVLQAPHQRQSRDAARSRARVDHLGKRARRT